MTYQSTPGPTANSHCCCVAHPDEKLTPATSSTVHSRLLERAAKYAAEYGGGSLTALPIIETQAGDISAYIPTNVISITDGQIYLETDLFNEGIRPAISPGLSVSRVGGAAQTKAMRRVAGTLRLELAQYHESDAFTQFGNTELDRTTRSNLTRGKRVVEVLKQSELSPMPLEKEAMILYAATDGYLDDVPAGKVRTFEDAFHEFMEKAHPEVGWAIAEQKEISLQTEATLRSAIEEYKQRFNPQKEPG